MRLGRELGRVLDDWHFLMFMHVHWYALRDNFGLVKFFSPILISQNPLTYVIQFHHLICLLGTAAQILKQISRAFQWAFTFFSLILLHLAIIKNISMCLWGWSWKPDFGNRHRDTDIIFLHEKKLVSLKEQVWSANRCVLSTFFSTFNMDRRTEQQAYFPTEKQFYISVMFLGFPDKIHKEKPSFLDFENN